MISEQINPLQPVGQAANFKFQVESKLSIFIWQSLPKANPDSRRQLKFLTAEAMVKLLGQHSCTAWTVQTGEHKNRVSVFPILLQSLLAGTGSLEGNVLPLLQY